MCLLKGLNLIRCSHVVRTLMSVNCKIRCIQVHRSNPLVTRIGVSEIKLVVDYWDEKLLLELFFYL